MADTPEGVLLRPLKPFSPTRVDEVFGSVGYRRRSLSLAQMDAAVAAEAPPAVIALDTNVVVRFLVNDDASQAQRARP